ncbi:MAG: GDP-L-fucose synthase [Candidatus Obscuribacterales bacterium]|nr:GDP-L-fucose synthase [Candidatus Obscuribacterales bacterium]
MTGRRIFVAGHGGMVGGALMRRLRRLDCEIVTVSRTEVDLRDQLATHRWIGEVKPQAVFVTAATVGGILANNSCPADFLYDNLMIATNVIEASRLANVEKLMFLGSSCVYPKLAPQPISEDALLTGPLEPTNKWYAIAKIAALEMCSAYRIQYGCDFISVQPTNLYGPGDTYDLHSSHVIPALIMKAHAAKLAGLESVEIWGTGHPLREFLHVDDLADALLFIMQHYSEIQPLNVGCGSDISIAELVDLIFKTVGYTGVAEFNSNMPDGTPRKLLDISRLAALGWQAKISLSDGLRQTYDSYLAEMNHSN